MRLVGAEHVARGRRALLLGAAPALEPDAAAVVERMGEGAAVAGGEDRRVGGGEAVVDGDAVVAGEPGGLGERGVGDGADADDDEIGGDAAAVGEESTAVRR